ncbi:MAG: tryptophan 2,3-dioxygenase [Longimicrobiales bacterium]
MKRKSGEPQLSYASYLRVPELTGLQQLISDPPQHDELLFIVVHQVYELWFKQILHELDGVIASLDADQPLNAQRLLRRCIEIERVLIEQIRVLETMTPNDFLRFRDRLMPASGFQSAQFRQIEFLCGVGEAKHLDNFAVNAPERDALERRLHGRSVGTAFYDLLRRQGFELPEGEAGREQRVRELSRIYQQPEEHYTVYLLAESLVELDETFTLWRLHHITMVERIIGARPGTGGSEGVGYLRGTLGRKFFPELWEVRSTLSPLS